MRAGAMGAPRAGPAKPAGDENEGHKISGHVVTESVMTEFRKVGVVGPNGGQTRIGALLAGKLIGERYADAF